MPYSNDPFMDLARVGYEAYVARYSDDMPTWGELPQLTRNEWRAAAKAMKLHVDYHGWPEPQSI